MDIPDPFGLGGERDTGLTAGRRTSLTAHDLALICLFWDFFERQYPKSIWEGLKIAGL
jgi:hypothetical protein